MNHMNYRPVRGKASPYKGVIPTANPNRWRAELYLPNNQKIRLGSFDSEIEAALAYDEAALQHLGPNVFLNSRDLERRTKPVIEGTTALIPTINGPAFRIDLEDVERVSQYYWRIHQGVLCGTRAQNKIQLHQLLMGGFPTSLVAVHQNGDPLDCRKDNIILAPRCLQIGRLRKRKGCRSIYKGVRKTVNGTWSAKVGSTHLGTYKTEEDAARAYDMAARKRFGICAAVNFPRAGEVSCRRADPLADLLAA